MRSLDNAESTSCRSFVYVSDDDVMYSMNVRIAVDVVSEPARLGESNVSIRRLAQELDKAYI
jgi:hypothetical protein